MIQFKLNQKEHLFPKGNSGTAGAVVWLIQNTRRKAEPVVKDSNIWNLNIEIINQLEFLQQLPPNGPQNILNIRHCEKENIYRGFKGLKQPKKLRLKQFQKNDFMFDPLDNNPFDMSKCSYMYSVQFHWTSHRSKLIRN